MRRYCAFYSIILSPTLQGTYEEAGRHYRRALELAERALGKDHPEDSFTLNNLATLQKKVSPRVRGCALCAYHAY